MSGSGVVLRYPQVAPATDPPKLTTEPTHLGSSIAASTEFVEGSTYKNAVISTLSLAWNEHRPISLSPDDFWLLIVHGVSIHINKYSKQLRGRILPPDAPPGKQDIELKERPDATIRPLDGSTNWAVYFLEFAAQIRAKTAAGVADALVGPTFSTTTPLHLLVRDVTLMEATKSYFSFGIRQMCGYPAIHIQGTKEDWQQLHRNATELITALCFPTEEPAELKPEVMRFLKIQRSWEITDALASERGINIYRATSEELKPLCKEVESIWDQLEAYRAPSKMKKHMTQWMEALDSVLTEAVKVFDHDLSTSAPVFWQQILCEKPVCGSGHTEPEIVGWINAFFPYIAKRDEHARFNQFCLPWTGMKRDPLNPKDWDRWSSHGRSRDNDPDDDKGLELDRFAGTMADVPVELRYISGAVVKVCFKAGILGGVVDKTTGAYTLLHAWRVEKGPKEEEKKDGVYIGGDAAEGND